MYSEIVQIITLAALSVLISGEEHQVPSLLKSKSLHNHLVCKIGEPLSHSLINPYL